MKAPSLSRGDRESHLPDGALYLPARERTSHCIALTFLILAPRCRDLLEKVTVFLLASVAIPHASTLLRSADKPVNEVLLYVSATPPDYDAAWAKSRTIKVLQIAPANKTAKKFRNQGSRYYLRRVF
jgi:hypothetical protein